MSSPWNELLLLYSLVEIVSPETHIIANSLAQKDQNGAFQPKKFHEKIGLSLWEKKTPVMPRAADHQR